MGETQTNIIQLSVLFVFPAINPLETSSEEYNTSCNFSFRMKEKSYLAVPCALYIIDIMKYLGSFSLLFKSLLMSFLTPSIANDLF